MNISALLRWTLAMLVVMAVMQPPVVSACSSCFGQVDSPWIRGVGMGVLSLLGVVLAIWTAVIAFFVTIARRASAVAKAAAAKNSEPLTSSVR